MKCELTGIVMEIKAQCVARGQTWAKVLINGKPESIPIPQDWLDRLPADSKVKITIETIE